MKQIKIKLNPNTTEKTLDLLLWYARIEGDNGRFYCIPRRWAVKKCKKILISNR